MDGDRAWVDGLETVFFDLGGTLFEHLPKQHTERNLHAMLPAPLGRDLTASDFDTYHALRRDAEAEYAARPFFLHRDLVCESFRRFAAQLGVSTLRAAQVAAFYEAQRASVTTHLRLRPGVNTLLAALQAAGLQCAIVSNIDEDYLQPLMARTGLQDQVAWVLSSEAAGSCKPDARIYELALARAACAPSQALFVGDSLQNDVRGPQRFGLHTCWLREAGDRAASMSAEPSLVVGELSELGAFLLSGAR